MNLFRALLICGNAAMVVWLFPDPFAVFNAMVVGFLLGKCSPVESATS